MPSSPKNKIAKKRIRPAEIRIANLTRADHVSMFSGIVQCLNIIGHRKSRSRGLSKENPLPEGGASKDCPVSARPARTHRRRCTAFVRAIEQGPTDYIGGPCVQLRSSRRLRDPRGASHPWHPTRAWLIHRCACGCPEGRACPPDSAILNNYAIRYRAGDSRFFSKAPKNPCS